VVLIAGVMKITPKPPDPCKSIKMAKTKILTECSFDKVLNPGL
jgi:hypothetical protein